MRGQSTKVCLAEGLVPCRFQFRVTRVTVDDKINAAGSRQKSSGVSIPN